MSATSRYHLEPAPSGLFLVQDLVNTRGVPAYGVRDLLGTVTDAQRWVRTSVRTWQRDAAVAGGVRRLTSADLPALRRLRAEVERAVLREAGTPRELPARLAVDADGRVSLQPSGTGVDWLAGAVWGEVLAGQRDGPQPAVPVRVPRRVAQQQPGVARRAHLWQRREPAGLARPAPYRLALT